MGYLIWNEIFNMKWDIQYEMGYLIWNGIFNM